MRVKVFLQKFLLVTEMFELPPDIEQLPEAVLLHEVLPNLPLSTLFSLCKSSNYYNQLCKSDEIWRVRLYKEFPDAGTKPTDVTWYDFYFNALNWYDKTVDKFPQLEQKPNNLLWSQYYNRLVSQSAITKDIAILDDKSAKILYVDQINIYPGITTLEMLFDEIYEILKIKKYGNNVVLLGLITTPPFPPGQIQWSVTIPRGNASTNKIWITNWFGKYVSNVPYNPTHFATALSNPNTRFVVVTAEPVFRTKNVMKNLLHIGYGDYTAFFANLIRNTVNLSTFFSTALITLTSNIITPNQATIPLL